MNRNRGFKMYGNERVCTGAHIWGLPSESGVIMCELCHTCIMARDLPRAEWDTERREAIEDNIQWHKNRLYELQAKQAQGWHVSEREIKDICAMLTSLVHELDAWYKPKATESSR